jgi:thiol-disulfide isomerase/thioredoxin
MRNDARKIFYRFYLSAMMATSLLLSACSQFASPAIPATAPTDAKPDWFKLQLIDVRTDKPFSIDNFSGKVVLIETIAEWCPNCLFQQNETRKVRKLLGDPQDLILLSLDVDSYEDAASLKQYTEEFGFDWRFAVASLEVERAMGNLYSAEYLNPPLEPMLLIDRKGNTYNLPYGIKDAEALKKILEPYLTK